MSAGTQFADFVSRFAYRQPVVEEANVSRRGHVIRQAPTGKSKGERMIQRVLEECLHYRYGRDYTMEFVFEEMGRPLRFDFYVRKDNFIIEFDGEQHYAGSRFHRTRKEWLEAIDRDEIKNEFCRAKGISLLRIPDAFTRHPARLRDLITGFVNKVICSQEAVFDVDLYFLIKAGKVVL